MRESRLFLPRVMHRLFSIAVVVLAVLTAVMMVGCALFVPPAALRNDRLNSTVPPSSDARDVTTKTDPNSTCTIPLRSTNPIVTDQTSLPDSLDPAVSYSNPGWGAIQQVYQGLVNYNGSSTTSFVGVLATNWTEHYDPLTGYNSWTFSLHSGVHFSNGDPYNAYVQWYSFYRSLLLAQGPQFILEQNFYSTNFSTTSPLSYGSPLSDDQAANETLAVDLNSWNFFDPNATEVTRMTEPLQSFQVINNLTIQLNLGYGYLASNYTYLLATLASPLSYAVDPAFIQAHGGVQPSSVNDYVMTHTMGTGQYVLGNYSSVAGGGYLLTPSPSYWGADIAPIEPWNSVLQPANTSIQIRFQATIAAEVSDLLNGVAASASFPNIDTSTLTALQGNACVSVVPLPVAYGATAGSDWVFLNRSVFPFSNLSVREAIAHAINYTGIIQAAFGGWAQQWVGPVPPGYPYYDPASLPPYAYNLSLAQQEIAQSPCANNACLQLKINFAYLDTGSNWAEMAKLLTTDLRQIGLSINSVPISVQVLYDEQSLTDGACISSTTVNEGPFYMGQEFYSSDYFAPDDWTFNDAYSLGSANECMAGYSNATVDELVFRAAADSNPANLTADYGEMTELMDSNYSDLWLVAPTEFEISSIFLHGVIPNPMGNAEPAAVLYSSEWAKNPGPVASYPVTFRETGLPLGRNWSVTLSRTAHNSTGTSIAFSEPNGNYSFRVGSIVGYHATPEIGYVVVNSGAAGQTINFTANASGGTPTFLGLSGVEGLALLAVLVVVAAAVVVWVLWWTRRRAASPGPPPQRPGQD